MPPSPGSSTESGLTGTVAARAAVALLYVAVQLALVFTGDRRSDGAFAFRMFNESSSVEARLYREVDAPSGHGTVKVPAPNGRWHAHDAAGNERTFDWYDRVKSGAVAALDRKAHASYGAQAQVDRLHAALDDVAAHVKGDTETRALVLEIQVSKNGRTPVPVTFTASVGP